MTTNSLRMDLAPTGKLRVGINYGNPVLAKKNSTSGDLLGVAVDLARELARRADVPVELIGFESAGKMFEAVKTGAWDIAFLAIDELVAADLIGPIGMSPQKLYVITKRGAAVAKSARGAGFHELGSWPVHPGFLAAHAESIREELARFPDSRPESTHLLYSAHSIPKKLVTREGDPYPREVEASVAAIDAALGGRSPSSLAYQSKLGPVEWVGPPTLEEIGRLGRAGVEQVLVVPIAFVSDHVETLYEVDQLFAETARRAGIAHFRRTTGLNDRPTFLRALADLAISIRPFWG